MSHPTSVRMAILVGAALTVTTLDGCATAPIPRRGQLADKEELRRELSQHFDDVGRCYTTELPFNSHLEGELVLHVVVDRQGRVIDPYITKSTLLSPSVEHCIVEQARDWRVPVPPRQATHLATRFTLQPGE